MPESKLLAEFNQAIPRHLKIEILNCIAKLPFPYHAYFSEVDQYGKVKLFVGTKYTPIWAELENLVKGIQIGYNAALPQWVYKLEFRIFVRQKRNLLRYKIDTGTEYFYFTETNTRPVDVLTEAKAQEHKHSVRFEEMYNRMCADTETVTGTKFDGPRCTSLYEAAIIANTNEGRI